MALVMFDYDGVIADSLDFHCQDFIAAFHDNGFYGVNTTEELLALYDGNVYASLLEMGLDAGKIEKIMDSYAIKQAKHLAEVNLFDGMAQALASIGKKHKLFIITSNFSNAIFEVMQRFGIDCIVDVIGAEKEISKIKKIRNTISIFPHLPAYYIGDTKGDMLEGKRAGAKTIGVAWGWHGVQKLQEGNPDYIVHTPEELVEVLNGQPVG